MVIKKILVTGGLGYIGSHTVLTLFDSGYDVVIVDNLSNSSLSVLDNLEKITQKKIKFYQTDVLKYDDFVAILEVEKVDAVIHFAAFKSVAESIQKPHVYHVNNVMGTHSVLKAMYNYGVRFMVFSSSAVVYENNIPPFNEQMKLETTNPYGQSKKASEFLLKSYSDDINGVSLRYFNPVGSHKSSLIGDNPTVPNNIMPILNRVANGQLNAFNIYGDDYDTEDGTAVRDYVHVMDVANAHVMALKYLEKNTGYEVFNIGTGIGHSVLNLVDVYQRSTGLTFETNILERRPGDVAISYSDVSKAKNKLGFETKYTLEQMCIDSYKFARRNL